MNRQNTNERVIQTDAKEQGKGGKGKRNYSEIQRKIALLLRDKLKHTHIHTFKSEDQTLNVLHKVSRSSSDRPLGQDIDNDSEMKSDRRRLRRPWTTIAQQQFSRKSSCASNLMLRPFDPSFDRAEGITFIEAAQQLSTNGSSSGKVSAKGSLGISCKFSHGWK